MKPTGTHITYYIICQRKLWLFAHHISFESSSETVKIGKVIDESTFNRERKSRMVDGIVNLDFIKGNRIVHEIKKSDALEDAHIWQVKYYLYILKNKGIEIENGVIHYPKQKRTTTVTLEPSDIFELEATILPEITQIVSNPLPPKREKKSFCKSCSYYEFCYV